MRAYIVEVKFGISEVEKLTAHSKASAEQIMIEQLYDYVKSLSFEEFAKLCRTLTQETYQDR